MASTENRGGASDVEVPLQLVPRMLTISVIQNVPSNTPPVVMPMSYTLLEDQKDFKININYTDDDDDEVVFELLTQPSHGTANISANRKFVYYTPNPNYSGVDYIFLSGDFKI